MATLKQRLEATQKVAQQFVQNQESGFDAIDSFSDVLEALGNPSVIMKQSKNNYPYLVVNHIVIWVSKKSLKDATLESLQDDMQSLKVGYSTNERGEFWTLFKQNQNGFQFKLEWD